MKNELSKSKRQLQLLVCTVLKYNSKVNTQIRLNKVPIIQKSTHAFTLQIREI